MKLFFKKLNNAGVAHHALVAVMVITGFAGFGAYRVFSSSAATSQAILSIRSQDGCELAGRNYDPKSKDSNKCQDSCSKNSAEFVKYDAAAKRPAYCKGFVTLNIDQAKCIDQLHRVYIDKLGCARKENQNNQNNSRYCQEGYPNYVADGNTDKCIADKVVTQQPQNNGSSGSGGSTNSTPDSNSDDIEKQKCQLLGRSYKNKACERVCVDGSGTLLKDTASKVMYCSNAVAPDATSAERCAQLHRIWVDAGCARVVGQKDTNNAPQCLPGFPYYNADFTASKGKSTKTDVCEKDKATADANERSGILGGVQLEVATNVPVTPPADNNCQTGDTSARCIVPCEEDRVRNSEGRCVTAPNPESEPGTSSLPSDPVDEQPDGFKITVFKNKNFGGDKLVFTSAQPTLPKGWNDSISSYKIQKGRWQICADADFKTDCRRVWASDPDMSDNKNNINNKTSSLRPITITTFEDAPADVIAACVDKEGQPVAAGEDNTCPVDAPLTCPTDFELVSSGCKAVVIDIQNIVPVDDTFKGENGKEKCELLGREWIGKVDGKTINGGQYGCSVVTCRLAKDGAPRQLKDGPVCVSNEFDKAYAQGLSEKRCTELHRVWIEQVKRCASVPDRKDKDQTKVKAEQCVGEYSTYYIYKSKEKEDECFKPDFFGKVKGVVKVTGGGFGKALQLGPKTFCNTAKGGDYHWTGKTCKIDRHKCWNGKSLPIDQTCPPKPVPPVYPTQSSGTPSSATGSSTPTSPTGSTPTDQAGGGGGGGGGNQQLYCPNGGVLTDGICAERSGSYSPPAGCQNSNRYGYCTDNLPNQPPSNGSIIPGQQQGIGICSNSATSACN